jgi:putative transcriptional regulator
MMKTRIKEFRAKHNLTQQDLANRVSVRRETIVFLEKGKYNPSLKLAYDISKVFKTKIEEIFIFTEYDKGSTQQKI